MSDLAEHVRGQGGYRDYQEAAAGLPAKSFPWGTLATNVLGIAGSHALGYGVAGTLTKLLAPRLGPSFSNLHPDVQRQIIAHAVGVAGTVATVAGSLATLAGQLRVAEEVARIKSEREAAAGNPKLAAVLQTYEDVLTGRRW